MKVFRNRAEAEKAGFVMRSKTRAIHVDGLTIQNACVLSPLERQLTEALEAVEWGGNAGSPGAYCPCCIFPMHHGMHDDNCKLSLALKASRGETP